MKVTLNLSCIKAKILKLLKKLFSNLFFQIIILIGAIFVVFSGDLEIYAPEEGRLIINDIRTGLFFFFLFEFISMNLIDSSYMNSLYFYIDFIDLISLITEVQFIWLNFLKYLDKQTM